MRNSSNLGGPQWPAGEWITYQFDTTGFREGHETSNLIQEIILFLSNNSGFIFSAIPFPDNVLHWYKHFRQEKW